MSIADAVHGYNLFLGRQPDSPRVAEERAAVPMAESVAAFLNSEEFFSLVLRPLLDGHPLPNVRLSTFPGPDIRAWISTRLPIQAAREALADAKTWRQLLFVVLSDEALFRSAGLEPDHEVYKLVSKSLHQHRAFEKEREVIGVLEEVTATEIRGWAANLLDLDEAPMIEFLLDNIFIGVIKCNRFRRDVQDSLKGGGYYGFSFVLPAAHHDMAQQERLLTVRDALSRLPVAAPLRVRMGQTEALDSLMQIRRNLTSLKVALQQMEEMLPSMLGQASYPLEMYSEYQHECQRTIQATALHDTRNTLENAARFSIVIDGPPDDVAGLANSIRSLRRQAYQNWECIVARGPAGTHAERAEITETFSRADIRVRETEVDPALERSAWLNHCASVASGEYLIFLPHGDVLTEDALSEIARAADAHTFDLLYFDEDKVVIDDARRFEFHSPKLKTAFDYDLLLADGYIGSAFAVAKGAFEKIDGFRSAFAEAQTLDLLLRLVESVEPKRIRHVARILYHNIQGPHGLAAAEILMPDRDQQSIACINDHFERTGRGGHAVDHDDPCSAPRAGCRRIHWALPDPAPTVSIIIPTRDEVQLLDQCLRSVLASLPNYAGKVEIIIVDNDSCEEATLTLFEEMQAQHGVQTLAFRGAFNWAAINNHAARRAKGDVLIFLNNDTVVLSADWLTELASLASRPDVGVVGARLLYEDGTIQHAGVVLGVSGGAIHEGIGQAPSDGGYDGRTLLQHRALAVTGACLASSAKVFEALNGFDEVNLGVEFNDTDYCLRAHDHGLAVLYTPFATLYHFESKSRGIDRTDDQVRRSRRERNVVSARWRKYIDSDPYYNAHFDRMARPFSRIRPTTLMPDGWQVVPDVYWDIDP